MRKPGLWTALLLGWASVCAAQVTFTVFPGPSVRDVAYVTTGPDGNLWFTQACNPSQGLDCNYIGRMTTAGTITLFRLPNVGIYGPGGTQDPIVTASDGNLWYTHYFAQTIGRIDPLTGVITEFPIPSGWAFPWGITAGPDGNLWFTEFSGTNIGKIDPLTGVITEYPLPGRSTEYGAMSITAGPDGNLWYVEPLENTIGRITPAGVVTEFLLPTADSYPSGITAGPDGNVWFTESAANRIGRITPAGLITEFDLPGGATPSTIICGPDGNLWFAKDYGKIGRITPTGAVTEFSAPDPESRPSGMTIGPDGNLWFTEYLANKIVKVQPAFTIRPLYDQAKAVKSGATIPIKLQLCDAEGGNLSSPDAVVRATVITRLSNGATEEPKDSGNANPDRFFRYDSTLGGTGGYIFNLGTRGLAPDNYSLSVTVGSDPTVYRVLFQVR